MGSLSRPGVHCRAAGVLECWPMSLHYAARGHAYVASPGEAPEPLTKGAPPFAATQTTERRINDVPQHDRRSPANAFRFGSASSKYAVTAKFAPKSNREDGPENPLAGQQMCRQARAGLIKLPIERIFDCGARTPDRHAPLAA